MSACYCTYLFVSLVVGQVIGSGIVVVTGTRVSSASHQQGLDDGGVARGGGLVERSSVVLSCSVHLSPSVEIGRNDATRLTFLHQTANVMEISYVLWCECQSKKGSLIFHILRKMKERAAHF